MADKLKDQFFTSESIRSLAESIQSAYPDFETELFLELVYGGDWPDLELKAKMHHVTHCLNQTLPLPYAQALSILREVAPGTRGFEAMVFPDFVEHYGMDEWELSLPALKYFTHFASSEFAIRPFIIEDAGRAMAAMYDWSRDPDHHVRRLSSEGCRPRLPWAIALPAFKRDPTPILPILEQLKDDESEYVRRSVANNLNDISKDHPDVVLSICERWQGQSERTDWIVKHACRTMLKAGNPRAMLLFGFTDPSHIEVRDLTIDKGEIAIGESVRFTFEVAIDGEETSKVRLEYVVDFVKANGKRSRKVFQIGESEYEPGHYEKTKAHSFADMSTRKHYPGEHHVIVVVNGVEKAQVSVVLTEP